MKKVATKDKQAVMKRNPNMVTRKIDQETVLVPIFKTSEEINCIYSLNTAASFIWEMIDGKRTLAQMKSKIMEQFDTTTQETEKKLQECLKDLRDIQAVL